MESLARHSVPPALAMDALEKRGDGAVVMHPKGFGLMRTDVSALAWMELAWQGIISACDAMFAEVELVLARSIRSGKRVVLERGDAAAVQSAVEAGAQILSGKGLLVNKVVIPSPCPKLLNEMI